MHKYMSVSKRGGREAKKWRSKPGRIGRVTPAFKDNSFTQAGLKGSGELNTVHIGAGFDQQLKVPRTHKENIMTFWKESKIH